MCCGTKRGGIIRCPLGCVYLSAAEQHPPAVVQRRRNHFAQWLGAAAAGLTERQIEVFLLLQRLLVVAERRLEAERLTDLEVAEAAGALAATAETAAKGLIYEHRAASLGAQRLAAELKTAFGALAEEGWRPADADLAAALRRVERAAREAPAAFGDARAYLAGVAELFPPSERRRAAAGPAEPGPRLIVP